MTVLGKADGWTTVKSNGKRKEKRVVPREVKILLEELKKSHGKRYGGYILKEKKVTGEGSGKGDVVEATESELIKNLWSELSKKKCAPKFIRLKKEGQEKSSYNYIRGPDGSRGRKCRRLVGRTER